LSRDAQDRIARPRRALKLRADSVRCQGGNAVERPFAGQAPRSFVTAAAQLDHHFLPWLVLDGTQGLLDPGLCGGELVIGKVRALDDIGINPQCRSEILRERRPAEAEMAA